MANVTAATGNYKGKLALPYVKPAIMAADTIVNGWCDVRPNVVGDLALRKFSGGAIQARTCGFTGQSGVTLGEVLLTTTKLEIKLQLCQKDLAATWEADLMSDSRFAPADTKEAMLNYIAEIAAQDVEKNLWHGEYNSADGTTSGGDSTSGFNGFNAKIVAGTPAYENLVTGATTSSTIATRLETLLGDAPSALYGDDNAYIYMSPKSKRLYYQYLATGSSGSGHTPALLEAADSYAGVKIVTPRGMADDTFIFSRWDNLAFGTDLSGNDFATQAAVVDLNESTLEDVVRGMIAFTAGTQIVDLDSLAVVRRSA
jgi:hypothetical protein